MRTWLLGPISLVLIIALSACVTRPPGWTPAPSSSGAATASTPASTSGSTPATPATTPAPTDGSSGAGGQTGSDDVIPALTPKAQLQPVPAGETNVAYAPNVPPA